MTSSWDSFPTHLHGVGVAELVWGKPAADPGGTCGVAELDANAGWRAGAAAGGAPKHAEERAYRQAVADAEPRLELLPSPPVHSDLAAFAALAAAHQHGAACRVEVALLKGESFR